MTLERAPGWYPFDDDPSRNRYWTGSEWVTPAEHATASQNPMASNSRESVGSTVTIGKLTALLLGALGLVAALVLALVPLSASGDDCGSALAPKDFQRQGNEFLDFYDEVTFESDCGDAVNGRRVFAGVLAVISIGLIGLTPALKRGPSSESTTDGASTDP